MPVTRLDHQQLQQALDTLEGWQLRDEKLYREFRFDDFKQAFAFMTRAALWAEQHNHHPEWFNVYNRVEVSLTTHDADGISQLDVNFARFLSALYVIGK